MPPVGELSAQVDANEVHFLRPVFGQELGIRPDKLSENRIGVVNQRPVSSNTTIHAL